MSFCIAEAGVNFNGSLDKAKKMADEARLAGADAVKFQTFWDIGKELKKYEMSKEQWRELEVCCDEIGIEFMTTGHWGSPLTFYKDEDYDVLDFINSLVKRHKIASPYLTNKKYVDKIISFGKPIIASTGSIVHPDGMATMKEIETFLGWFPQFYIVDQGEELKKYDLTLLHCISKYPPEEAHYLRVIELDKFGYPVGISDHTQNIKVPQVPVIEKHFKIDEECLDANVSLAPKDFKLMVKWLKFS